MPDQNPMAQTDPKPERSQCSATSKATGLRCEKKAIHGGTVCHYHGGGAPQVRAAAMERILQAVDPCLAALVSIVKDKTQPPADRVRAARDLLDRAGLVRKQGLELTGEDGKAIDITVSAADTLASRIAGIAARIGSSGSDSKPE